MTKLYMQKAGKNKQVSLKQGLVDRADTCTSSTMSRNYTIQLLRLGNLLGSILVVAPATNTNSRHSRCTTPARRQPCICSLPHQQKYEDLVSTNDYSLSPKAAKAAPGLQLE